MIVYRDQAVHVPQMAYDFDKDGVIIPATPTTVSYAPIALVANKKRVDWITFSGPQTLIEAMNALFLSGQELHLNDPNWVKLLPPLLRKGLGFRVGMVIQTKSYVAGGYLAQDPNHKPGEYTLALKAVAPKGVVYIDPLYESNVFDQACAILGAEGITTLPHDVLTNYLLRKCEHDVPVIHEYKHGRHKLVPIMNYDRVIQQFYFQNAHCPENRVLC